MKSNALQTSFAGGELSPRLKGRVDSELYKRGLSHCENLIPKPHGALLGRDGSDYLDTSTNRIYKLFGLTTTSGQEVAVGLASEQLLLFDSAGRRKWPTNLVLNGTFSSGLTSWTTEDAGHPWHTDIATVVAGELALGYGHFEISFPPTHTEGHGSAYQDVVVADAGSYTFKFKLRIRDKGPSDGSITPKCRFVLKVVGETPLVDETIVDPYDSVITRTVTLEAAHTYRIWFSDATEISFGVYTGTWCYIDDVILSKASDADHADNASWTAALLAEAQLQTRSGDNAYRLTNPKLAPKELLYDPTTGVWTLQAITFTSAPASWAASNWPAIVELFGGRAWWMQTPDKPNGVWASRAGLYHDIGQDTPVDADSAIILELATRGAIRWCLGQKHLLVGTDEGEHAFLPVSGVMWQGDIDARTESAYGASAAGAVHAGNKALYVGADGRKVRFLGYDLNQDGWVQQDITFPAEHLFQAGIDELHFAKDPHGTIVVLSGGQLYCCTLDEGSKTAGWWRLTTRGSVQTCCVTNGSSGSWLWFAVDRGNGQTIERMRFRESSVDEILLDSRISAVVAADGGIAGLTHLEGLEVQAVIDGQVIADLTVASGEVTVDVAFAGLTAVVGLAYPAVKAVTLPPAEVPPGAKKRMASVTLRLNNSALPLVNGERAPDRTPATNMDEREPLTTGDVTISTRGWDDDGAVTIEQDLPLRTEILAIFGELAANAR